MGVYDGQAQKGDLLWWVGAAAVHSFHGSIKVRVN